MSQAGATSASSGGGGTSGIVNLQADDGSLATGTTVKLDMGWPLENIGVGSTMFLTYDNLWDATLPFGPGTFVQYKDELYIQTGTGLSTGQPPDQFPAVWSLVGSKHTNQQFCTGVLTGGFLHLTTAAPSSTVTADAGTGYIGDVKISWTSQASSPPVTLAAGQVAYFYIDSAGVLQWQGTPLSPTDRRTKIYLGVARVNIASTNWSAAADAAQMSADGFDFVDLALAVGPINYTGNTYSLPTTTTLNKTSGTIFNLNAGDRSLTPENANFIGSAASTPVTFAPTYRSAVAGQWITGTPTTTLDLLNWDNGSGTLQTLGNALYTNKRIYQRANSAAPLEVLVFYGQTTYATQALALSGLSEENFTIPGVVQELYILRGFITHNGGVTPTAVISQADKFGTAAAGGGGGGGGGDVLGPASSPTHAGAFYADTTGKLLEAPVAALSNGQLYIGATGLVPVAATVGTSNGITSTVGAGTLSLAGVNATSSTIGVSRYATNIEASAQTLSTAALTPSNITSMFNTSPLLASQGGTGNASNTLNGILIGNGPSAIKATAAPTDGQLLIGSTGVQPVLSTLTAGQGIAITNGTGSITLNAFNSYYNYEESFIWGNVVTDVVNINAATFCSAFICDFVGSVSKIQTYWLATDSGSGNSFRISLWANDKQTKLAETTQVVPVAGLNEHTFTAPTSLAIGQIYWVQIRPTTNAGGWQLYGNAGGATNRTAFNVTDGSWGPTAVIFPGFGGSSTRCWWILK